MKEIPLSRGYKAIVDDIDYTLVSKYTWFVRIRKSERTPYACAKVGDRHILMHKLITGYSVTDHKNTNGLDNRRENLRVGTNSTNKMNARKQRGHYTSIYKGVSLRKGRWRAVIYLNRRQYHIGTFDSEIEAAKAYNVAASNIFGRYALLNFTD
jgi:hypothetical protein